jgi:Tol biopolymer transport system component
MMTGCLVCGLAAIVVGAALPAPAPESPPAWSPDGRWLAYVLAVREPSRALPPGWLFEPAGAEAAPAAPPPRTYRLWATQPGGGESVLLDESPRPIVSPSWNADGTRLAYGRQAAGAGPSRLEVVLQDAPDRRQVLATLPADPAAPLDGAAIAWSPDGRHVAVALPGGPGRLLVLRAENGKSLKEVPGARAPSWSPDGSRLAFFRGDDLALLDASLGEPVELLPLVDVPALPAPIWSRDGRTLWVVLRGSAPPAPGRVAARGERADLMRVAIDTGRAATVRELLHEPVVGAERLLGISLTFDADGDQLFYTTVVAGQRSQVTWAFPRDRAVRSRFNPVDEWTPLACLRFAPAGSLLALRAGGGGPEAPVLLCDSSGSGATLLAPDAAARAEWTALLVGAMRRVLAEHPRQDAEGNELPRPTLLPAPGELSAQSMLLPRLRNLARIGASLAGPADPEARLAFAYLDQDPEAPAAAYGKAREAIDGVAAVLTIASHRERLLVLRSQIDLGLGERDRALAMLKYLRAGRPGPVQRVEETARGFVLSPVADPLGAWLADLERRASEPGDGEGPAAGGPAGTDAMGNVNFDAPQPGLGLDPIPPAPPPDPKVDDVPVFPRAPAGPARLR